MVEIERKIEMREREERRRSIIIKAVEGKDKKRREAVEVLKVIIIRADIEDIKKEKRRRVGRYYC